ncbi:hypothetical protein BOH66_13835 [Microbacterium aurum]|uniref:Glycosyltransferase 2-like domain-containing protein n=1 Tax=Microbacterium aurum TaxID=36805 RepID=A0A1P8UAU4_9MICO|nr:glycosyltransferase [Microbacterium aurum]APZ35205.1 hypothetical protein BOH66_13835 [Microbacterium aurum]MBM7829182.1 GT2 family glycosyltransferase [Microbacterium aurum]
MVTVSVVVVTYNRPDHVRTCLTRLHELHRPADEILVVDASPNDLTVRLVREEFPQVCLLRNELGRGTTAESRQIGFTATSGDIIAFVDDDAFAEPDWLDHLVVPYDDPSVVGVGGRALNDIEGEETRGLGDVGRLLADGRLTGNFAAHTGRVIEVDHLLGANMSFRRSALDAIGGIHGNYPGTCLCEESDISLRLKNAGGRLVYQPDALVHHVAAPYGIGGKRFDRRYLYYLRRNHVVMLVRVFGWRDPIVRYYARATVHEQRQYLWLAASHMRARKLDGEPRTVRQRARSALTLTRAVAELGGLVAGFPAAFVARRRDERDVHVAR